MRCNNVDGEEYDEYSTDAVRRINGRENHLAHKGWMVVEILARRGAIRAALGRQDFRHAMISLCDGKEQKRKHFGSHNEDR